MVELLAYQLARKKGKALAGICRGGQLLNVLCGGSMWQHVDNHGHSHDMVDVKSGEVVRTTSVHHQMMIPGADGEVTANCPAPVSKSKERMAGNGAEALVIHRQFFTPEPDIEAIWYPKHAAYCIQGHPEYVHPSNRLATYYMESLQRFFNFKSAPVIN